MRPVHRNNDPPAAADMRYIEELYRRYRGIMYKTALARAPTPADADDVVSEAVLRLFPHTDTLRALPERALIGYIAETTRRVAIDMGRRRSLESALFTAPGGPVPDALPGPEEAAVTEARLQLLQETLSELRAPDRALLTGRYLENKSDEELARELGVKPSGIRQKLSRARKRAAAIMRGKEADE